MVSASIKYVADKKSSAQKSDVIDGVKQVATTILLLPVHADDDQSGACAPPTQKSDPRCLCNYMMSTTLAKAARKRCLTIQAESESVRVSNVL